MFPTSSTLTASLIELDPRHPRIARLRGATGVLPTAGGLAALSSELLAEAAASLGRTAARLVEELELLERLGARLDSLEAQSTRSPADLDRLICQIETFNRQRKLAERRRWELLVQREAVGFTRNDILEVVYPVPPQRRIPRPCEDTHM